MAKNIYAGANTDEQFRTELLLSFREPQIYFFSGKFAKSSLNAPVAKLVDAHAFGAYPVRGAGSIPRGVKLAATLGMEDGGGIYVNFLRLEER